MPNVLEIIKSSADVRLNVETFNSEAARYYDRAARLLRETTYWVYDPISESFGPSKFVGFTEMSFDRYVQAVAGDWEGAQFDGGVTRAAIATAIRARYKPDGILRARLDAWGVDRFGPDAFGGADRGKWQFVSLPETPEAVAPRLALGLHERYARPEVYGLFGINYDTRRTRHLNTGLSPAMPDGGYFVFITLDKDTITEDYNYEDILFQDQLIWVTRRDPGEDDPDYVVLRQSGTRVSVFARRADKERFAYLGEVRWQKHKQFSNEGRVQQRYVLRLLMPVPVPCSLS
jgi:hypothetical protein